MVESPGQEKEGGKKLHLMRERGKMSGKEKRYRGSSSSGEHSCFTKKKNRKQKETMREDRKKDL